jgi:hypothetical protein
MVCWMVLVVVEMVIECWNVKRGLIDGIEGESRRCCQNGVSQLKYFRGSEKPAPQTKLK